VDTSKPAGAVAGDVAVRLAPDTGKLCARGRAVGRRSRPGWPDAVMAGPEELTVRGADADGGAGGGGQGDVAGVAPTAATAASRQ